MRGSNEQGFTLVELLVAAALSLVVFGAICTVLIGYQKDAVRTRLQNDAQDRARVAIDRIVRDLRNVAGSRTSPTLIEMASSYDLVFQTIGSPSGSNTAGITRVRYCLPADAAPGSASNRVIQMQTETWNTSAIPANPWSAGAACPFTPGSLPSGAAISTRRLAESITNRIAGASRAAFTFYPSAASLSTITAVGIDVYVDVSATQTPSETRLRSSAFIRNQNQVPIASFTATATGGGHVLLNAGSSSDPDGQTITFAWFRVSGGADCSIIPLPAGCTALPPPSSGFRDWATTPGTYTIQLVVTDPGGLKATQTQTVVVT